MEGYTYGIGKQQAEKAYVGNLRWASLVECVHEEGRQVTGAPQ